MRIIIKTVKHVKLNTKNVSAVLKTKKLKIIQYDTSAYVLININKKMEYKFGNHGINKII